MNGVLQKERVDRERNRGRRKPCENGGRDWSYAVKDKECIPEAGRGKEGL